MAETTRDRINGYIADAIAEEHAFANAIGRFHDAAPQGPVQLRFGALAEHAHSQAARLSDLLHARGASASGAKATLARISIMAPRASELFESPDERDTHHLILTLSALAGHSALYQALAAAASVTRNDDVARVAGAIGSEEQADRTLGCSSLPQDAHRSLRSELSRARHPGDLVCFHLDEAIAVQRSLESQLQTFAQAASEETAAGLIFQEYAHLTREQFEQLTRRLQSLGSNPSLLKGFLSQVFNFVPRLAAMWRDPGEALVQHLIAAYAFAHAQVATLTILRLAAELTEDETTAALAGALQQQHDAFLPRIWSEVGTAAQVSIGTMPYAAS